MAVGGRSFSSFLQRRQRRNLKLTTVALFCCRPRIRIGDDDRGVREKKFTCVHHNCYHCYIVGRERPTNQCRFLHFPSTFRTFIHPHPSHPHCRLQVSSAHVKLLPDPHPDFDQHLNNDNKICQLTFLALMRAACLLL